MSAIETRFTVLVGAPTIGAKREMFAPGLRVIFHDPYGIYYTYTPTPENLIIVRVLHGARDIAATAERGGFDYEAE